MATKTLPVPLMLDLQSAECPSVMLMHLNWSLIHVVVSMALLEQSSPGQGSRWSLRRKLVSIKIQQKVGAFLRDEFGKAFAGSFLVSLSWHVAMCMAPVHHAFTNAKPFRMTASPVNFMARKGHTAILTETPKAFFVAMSIVSQVHTCSQYRGRWDLHNGLRFTPASWCKSQSGSTNFCDQCLKGTRPDYKTFVAGLKDLVEVHAWQQASAMLWCSGNGLKCSSNLWKRRRQYQQPTSSKPFVGKRSVEQMELSIEPSRFNIPRTEITPAPNWKNTEHKIWWFQAQSCKWVFLKSGTPKMIGLLPLNAW